MNLGGNETMRRNETKRWSKPRREIQLGGGGN